MSVFWQGMRTVRTHSEGPDGVVTSFETTPPSTPLSHAAKILLVTLSKNSEKIPRGYSDCFRF